MWVFVWLLACIGLVVATGLLYGPVWGLTALCVCVAVAAVYDLTGRSS